MLIPGPRGVPQKVVRTLATMTAELRRLADGLQALGCTPVALAAPGVYWPPMYTRLEAACTRLLVHARHVKAVPGRKTDGRDGEWLAPLLRQGLRRARFVPERPQRELRELRRYRSRRVHERRAAVKRRQQPWAGANRQRAGIAADVLGVAGQAMLTALVAGTTEAPALADRAPGRRRAHRAERERAWTGRFGAPQRFLVAEQRSPIAERDARLARVGEALAARLPPADALVERRDALRGIGRSTAEGLVAELGTDWRACPSAAPRASWAGLGPGNPERAGQRRSGPTGQGTPYLRAGSPAATGPRRSIAGLGGEASSVRRWRWHIAFSSVPTPWSPAAPVSRRSAARTAPSASGTRAPGPGSANANSVATRSPGRLPRPPQTPTPIFQTSAGTSRPHRPAHRDRAPP